MKRYTILKRDFLERGKCNYYNMKSEYFYLFNATDKQIKNKLEELNKNYQTRFFEIYKDFKTTTEKSKKEFIYYLLNNKDNNFRIILFDNNEQKEI